MVSLPPALRDALDSAPAAEALRQLDKRGELTRLLPELEEGRGFEQPELHFYTVLDHNFAAVAAFDSVTGAGEDADELRRTLSWLDLDDALGRSIGATPLLPLLRLACLVHDVAKPEQATFVDGRLRFPRHGPRGAEMMRERLPALGLGSAETEFVSRLVRYHLRPGELVRAWPPTDRAVRRFVTDLDGHVLPLLLLQLSDGMATRGPGYTRENFRRHLNFLNYVTARSVGIFEDEEEALIDGHDLMDSLDLQSGRLLGALLTSIREAQALGTVSDRDEALAFARSRLAEIQGEVISLDGQQAT